jgi:hypothetical protein
VGLVQLVRFLVIELIRSGSVRGDVLINSDALLVTDFVNLKIKLFRSFGSAHSGRVCMRMFIEVSNRTCMNIYVCTVFLKKTLRRDEVK